MNFIILLFLSGCVISRPSQSDVSQVWAGGTGKNLADSAQSELQYQINGGHQDRKASQNLNDLLSGRSTSGKAAAQAGRIRKLLVDTSLGGELQDAQHLTQSQGWNCLTFPLTLDDPSLQKRKRYHFVKGNGRNEAVTQLRNRMAGLEWSRDEVWEQAFLKRLGSIGFPERDKVYKKNGSPVGWFWTSTGGLPSSIRLLSKFVKRYRIGSRKILLVENGLVLNEGQLEEEDLLDFPQISTMVPVPQAPKAFATHYEICERI